MSAALPAHARYSRAQIGLHWLIAALVFWQLFVAEAPNEPMRAAFRGRTADAMDVFLAGSHVWVGFAILALVIARVALRLMRPTPPVDEPNPLIALAARASHAAFYLLLFFMPLTGIAAWYFRAPTGDIHELGKPAFIALIAVHTAAALWHQFVRRDGTLSRMLPARS